MTNDQDRIQVRTDLFHDLTNTLIVVLGSLELLHRQPLDQEARRQLDRAQQGAERSTKLVQQMFAAAQSDYDHKNTEAGLMASTMKLQR